MFNVATRFKKGSYTRSLKRPAGSSSEFNFFGRFRCRLTSCYVPQIGEKLALDLRELRGRTARNSFEKTRAIAALTRLRLFSLLRTT